MSWLRRLSDTLRARHRQVDLDREFAFHIAELADRLRGEGLSDHEAERRARLQFGGTAVQAERAHDLTVVGWIDVSLRNVRYAIRALCGTPGFTVAAVVTLALSIGANAAVFSVIDAVLLRPLQFRDSDRLMFLTQTQRGTSVTQVPPARVEDWHRLNSSFDAIAAFYTDGVVDTTGDLPERLRRAVVSPRFLEVLALAPEHGRAFAESEYRSGTAPVILISDHIWRSRFGARPGIVGTVVRIDGQSVSIIGVMPPSPPFPGLDVDVWSPVLLDIAQFRAVGWYPGAIGRLKAGVTLEQARANLAVVQTQLGEQYPDTDRTVVPRIVPLKESVVGDAGRSLWLVYGAVSVLLLIACTNIAALLLSRGAQREHEVGVRFALGASRGAVAAQMLTEAEVLALVLEIRNRFQVRDSELEFIANAIHREISEGHPS